MEVYLFYIVFDCNYVLLVGHRYRSGFKRYRRSSFQYPKSIQLDPFNLVLNTASDIWCKIWNLFRYRNAELSPVFILIFIVFYSICTLLFTILFGLSRKFFQWIWIELIFSENKGKGTMAWDFQTQFFFICHHNIGPLMMPNE